MSIGNANFTSVHQPDGQKSVVEELNSQRVTLCRPALFPSPGQKLL